MNSASLALHQIILSGYMCQRFMVKLWKIMVWLPIIVRRVLCIFQTVNGKSTVSQQLVIKYSLNAPPISISTISLYLDHWYVSIMTHFTIQRNVWTKKYQIIMWIHAFLIGGGWMEENIGIWLELCKISWHFRKLPLQASALSIFTFNHAHTSTHRLLSLCNWHPRQHHEAAGITSPTQTRLARRHSAEATIVISIGIFTLLPFSNSIRLETTHLLRFDSWLKPFSHVTWFYFRLESWQSSPSQVDPQGFPYSLDWPEKN